MLSYENCWSELSRSNLHTGQSCLAVLLLGPEELPADDQDTFPNILSLS